MKPVSPWVTAAVFTLAAVVVAATMIELFHVIFPLT